MEEKKHTFFALFHHDLYIQTERFRFTTERNVLFARQKERTGRVLKCMLRLNAILMYNNIVHMHTYAHTQHQYTYIQHQIACILCLCVVDNVTL